MTGAGLDLVVPGSSAALSTTDGASFTAVATVVTARRVSLTWSTPLGAAEGVALTLDSLTAYAVQPNGGTATVAVNERIARVVEGARACLAPPPPPTPARLCVGF